ncbi:MAG: small multi-drug export protein [Candidatus ainarchaeum sp.]|nr:small multi-drug export protein [Candidatus ainarchaeum sp.]
MIDKLIILFVLTLVPIFELRWSIPIGLFSKEINVPFIGMIPGFGLNPFTVFIVCVLANILLGMVAYFFFDKIIHLFRRIKLIDDFYDTFSKKTHKKVHPLVEKYGLIGMALFIAIPLPGSGSWTGALAGNLLDFGYKRFFIANAIGVIISGTIVTLLSLGIFFFL